MALRLYITLTLLVDKTPDKVLTMRAECGLFEESGEVLVSVFAVHFAAYGVLTAFHLVQPLVEFLVLNVFRVHWSV